MRRRDRKSQDGMLPRMEARPLKNGGQSYRYHPVGGKPINLGRDKAEAIRKVLDLTGRSDDDGTFAFMWRTYKSRPEYKKLAESTKGQYGDNWLELEKRFGKMHVAGLRPMHIDRYLRVERASAPIVANREFAVLSNLCKLAAAMGYIDRNPCKEVSRNPETPRDMLVEKSVFQKFVAWALQQGPSAVVLVSMAQFSALAGNRRAEFRTLHWPQVDEMEDLIRMQRAKQRQGKQKRELVSVSVALQVVIDRMKALKTYSPMGPVFPAPRTGRPYSEPGFKAMWGRLMTDALDEKVVEERFTFHDLRAHYTTYYKLKHGELPELHADKKTTEGVYERSKEVRRAAL